MLTTKEFRVFNTLVVPPDGSELAERAVPYAVRLANERGGRLVLVRAAIAPPPSGLDWARQQLDSMEEATAYLANVAEKVASRVPVTTAPLYGHASAQIVMATHGRTGIRRAVLGSVAGAVLTAGSAPVLLVSPAASGVSNRQPTSG